MPFLTRPSWPKKLVVPDGFDRNLNPVAFFADHLIVTGLMSSWPEEPAGLVTAEGLVAGPIQRMSNDTVARTDTGSGAEQAFGILKKSLTLEVFRLHPRLALFQVDFHAAAAESGTVQNRPLRVGMDPWVEVVNLGGEVCEVELTSVEIQSNEPERPRVNGAILAYIDTFHKAHIGVEQQRLYAAIRIPGGPSSPHVCDADKAFEIGDR